MNNIKFKAKCLTTEKWIFGGYGQKVLQADSTIAEVAIIPNGCYGVAVDPKTVCVLVYENSKGVEFYTNDIVSIHSSKHGEYKSTIGLSEKVGITLTENKSSQYDYHVLAWASTTVVGNEFNNTKAK